MNDRPIRVLITDDQALIREGLEMMLSLSDGIEATRRISAQYPRTRVIALTTYADDASIFGALEAGAMGYLTKDAGAREIVQAIQTVHAGEALLDPAVQARVIRQLRAGQPAGKPPATVPADLTPREV